MEELIYYIPESKSLISATPTGYKTKSGYLELIATADYKILGIKKGHTFLINELDSSLSLD